MSSSTSISTEKKCSCRTYTPQRHEERDSAKRTMGSGLMDHALTEKNSAATNYPPNGKSFGATTYPPAGEDWTPVQGTIGAGVKRLDLVGKNWLQALLSSQEEQGFGERKMRGAVRSRNCRVARPPHLAGKALLLTYCVDEAPLPNR